MTETPTEMIQARGDITTTLTEIETHQLKQCEKIIKSGLGTFIHVGQALATIRDNRLYREQYKTFEQYCKETWDLSRGYAYQQIGAYETVTYLESKMSAMADIPDETKMSAMADTDQPKILPINERQTRPLTKLSPEDQIRAWERVLDELNAGAKLTASLIQKAVKEVSGETSRQRVINIKDAVDRTDLVTPAFKRQYQIMLDIISEERNAGWKTMKRTEVVNYLKQLIKLVESDD